MLIFLVYVAVGAAGGHFLFVFAQRSTDRTYPILAEALAIVAFVYVAFAMASMESGWLAVEIAGLMIFLGFAYLGLRRSLSWLWVGWALHMLWDTGLHLIVETPFVPDWYPVVCIAFDAVVAYHVYRMQHVSKRTASAAA